MLAYFSSIYSFLESSTRQLNAFVAGFNSIKAISSNEAMLLRSSARGKHMKSCFSLYHTG